MYCVFYIAKKPQLKTFKDIEGLLKQGKKREVKLIIRENAWPVNATIRGQLWPALCAQHHHGNSLLDGFYWDMVNQVNSEELSQKECMSFP
jgi:TBC1 domain family member 24